MRSPPIEVATVIKFGFDEKIRCLFLKDYTSYSNLYTNNSTYYY